MNRRDFFVRTTATAGAIGLEPIRSRLLAQPVKKSATDRVKLGPAGIPLSRLAMGTGTSGSGGSSNQTRKLGLGGIADLFHYGFDNGLTFWDSADQYGTHPHMKQALKALPRERVAIMTKTGAATEKEMRADLDRYRREIGTDYIDIVLLHAMTEADWPERRKGAMAVLAEAREEGIIGTHGTSCHSLAALKTAAATPWVQVDLARINPAGIAMDADPATVIAVLRQMKAAGKGVIGMKILGAGRLRNKVDEALQFAMSLDCLDCITIGAESRDELAGLVSKIPAASLRG
jgi:aryl-alcohol dehydrogenase-like predicted oxidoreductase